jgi:hypothetical protein
MDGRSKSNLVAVGWFVGCLTTIVTGLIVGLVLLGLDKASDKARDDEKAAPALKFDKLESGRGYVDVLTKSDSSQEFFIHRCQYRILEVLREAPPQKTPPKPQPPQPPKKSKKELRRERKQQRKQAINHDSPPQVTKMIDPDEADVTPPSRFELGKWYYLTDETLSVGPYEPEKIRVRIVDPARAGARYKVEVKIPYGDGAKPKSLPIPTFEIDVFAE